MGFSVWFKPVLTGWVKPGWVLPSQPWSHPETFTDTTESGLESEDTHMIVDTNEQDKSLLIDGLEDTIPKNH